MFGTLPIAPPPALEPVETGRPDGRREALPWVVAEPLPNPERVRILTGS